MGHKKGAISIFMITSANADRFQILSLIINICACNVVLLIFSLEVSTRYVYFFP